MNEISKINKSEFRGIVTRQNVSYSMDHTFGSVLSFMIKLDQKIYGIPEEITVRSTNVLSTSMIIQEGDELLIKGKITKKKVKAWGVDVYYLKANHIFNKTTNFGF